MRRVVVLSLTLVLTVATALAQQTFRSAIDLVHFGVVVTDKQGSPIAGLTADDFEIKEAGKPQAIKFFAAARSRLKCSRTTKPSEKFSTAIS